MVTSEYCLIFNEPYDCMYEMFILQSFLYLLKEQKEWILFYLHQNALNGHKSQERTVSMQTVPKSFPIL